MKNKNYSLLLSVCCALALAVACGKSKAPASKKGEEAAASEPAPNQVVAKIGSETITAAQLDEQAKAQLGQLEEQYKKQRFQVRKQQLEQMLNERMLKAEAQKRGVTEEQLFKTEVEDKIPQPTDEQIKKVFDESSAQLPPGSTMESFRPQIVQFLTRNQKQEKMRSFMDELRKQNKVEVMFSEPRKQVEAKGPSRGPDNAKVTIIEFSDFECPFCGRAHDTVEQVMQAYAGKVRLVFRQFPLSFHPHAQKAAEASMCAQDQGKFWEYHDTLFKNQKALEVAQLKEHAKATGLDATKFDPCLDSGKFAQAVKDDMEAGSKAGVSGTPAFFINGVMLSGAQPFEEFKRVIDQELGSS